MLDFEIQRCTRRCAKTDRELQPGETFFSVLVPSGAEVIRQDFSVEAWTGPPEVSLGWWKSQLPDQAAKKVHWAPNDVMLHYFEQLEEQPEKLDVRYVLALLMVRRRVLRLDDTGKNEHGEETLTVFCPRNEKIYEVLVVTPDAARAEQIQEELARLLFGNEPIVMPTDDELQEYGEKPSTSDADGADRGGEVELDEAEMDGTDDVA